MPSAHRPSDHPDDDLLADLAADVLPVPDARVVEEHVFGCRRCASLLADSEGIRQILLADDPGPMPMEVLASIEEAIAAESALRDGRRWERAENQQPWGAEATPPAPTYTTLSASNGQLPDTQPPPTAPVTSGGRHSGPDEVDATPAPQAPPAYETSQFTAIIRRPPGIQELGVPLAPSPAETGTPWSQDGDEFASEADQAAPVTERPAPAARAGRAQRGPLATRSSRPSSRTRRQARDEDRDVRFGRRGTVLGIAAGLVVATVVGGWVLHDLTGSSGSTSAGSAANVSAVAAGGTSKAATSPVISSGTNYTDATLASQARNLVSRTLSTAAAGGGVKSPATGQAGDAKTEAAPQAQASSQAPSGNQDLRSPSKLQACLAALQVTSTAVVTVDLARYNGRDAAILVLQDDNGGYEVWAVARDCRPGAEGTLKVLFIHV